MIHRIQPTDFPVPGHFAVTSKSIVVTWSVTAIGLVLVPPFEWKIAKS
jgi:hypothetical protein